MSPIVCVTIPTFNTDWYMHTLFFTGEENGFKENTRFVVFLLLTPKRFIFSHVTYINTLLQIVHFPYN